MITWTLARALLRALYKDRAFWVNLVSLWSGWRSALWIVRPATVVRWHRVGFRWYWRFKCRPGEAGRRSRPPSASSSAG